MSEDPDQVACLDCGQGVLEFQGPGAQYCAYCENQKVTANAVLNGNRFVKQEHVFLPGRGCFYPSLEIAKVQGTSLNGTGFWKEEISFQSRLWYRAGNTNCFN
jgi:hypothetical protein